VSELAGLVVSRRDNVVVAGMTGELDVSNAAGLERTIVGGVSNVNAGLVLDLAGLRFMDSSGVHLLFNLAEHLSIRGQRLALILPRASAPRRVLELSGPQPRGWIHDSEDA
jgi:anti-anti-sigma factor